MHFNIHSDLEGCHAFLGASQYQWLNYDEEKLEERYLSSIARFKGTQLHEFAAQAIKLKVRLKGTRNTLNMYVNDAIGFGMTPEQPLFYSRNCFGTADAIVFNQNKSLLRIHDLKTGVAKASPHQLEIYNALFCLEYDVNPNDIDAELRIYQSNDIFAWHPERTEIMYIMDKIITFDRIIDRIKEEEM